MASIKNLKKDINFLTNEIIEDCILAGFINPEKEEKIKKLIEESLTARKELLAKTRKKHQSQSHYKAISKELLEKADATFSALSKIIAE